MIMSEEKEKFELEKEKANIYLSHWSRVYSQPPQGKETSAQKRARKEFLEAIRPESLDKKKKKDEGPKDWDIERMKQMKEQQQKQKELKEKKLLKK